MKHYHAVLKEADQVDALLSDLTETGIKKEDISVIMKQNEGIDFSDDALLDQEVQLKDAPSGTVSAFGITFAPLAVVAAGVLWIAAGPIAALAGGAAVAAGGIAMLMTGIGVPEEEHKYITDALNDGDVLVHIHTDKEADIAPIFEKYNTA